MRNINRLPPVRTPIRDQICDPSVHVTTQNNYRYLWVKCHKVGNFLSNALFKKMYLYREIETGREKENVAKC